MKSNKSNIYIPYEIYQELKNKKYKLSQGIKQFNFQEDIDNGVMFFDEDDNFIDPRRFDIEDIKPSFVLLPRFFWLENLDKLEEFFAVDDQGNKWYGADLIKNDFNLIKNYSPDLNYNNYNIKVQPRENQVPILDELNQRLKNFNYIRGILQAAPGTGKTYMSINFSKVFKKTLIIVPKNVLVDQWLESILTFTNLQKENIYILEGSKLNEIQENLNKNIKIIITKPQSLLSQIKKNKILDLIDLYSKIDFVIYDECHSAGAEGFSKTLSLFKTPNILGLTATPFRKGLNEFLLINSIGDVIIEADAKVLTPNIIIQYLPKTFIDFSEKEIFALKQRFQNDYPMFLALFNSYLLRKPNYFDFLAQWNDWARKNNHEVVILFSTNKLAKKQYNTIIEKNPEYKDEILYLTGNSKNDALQIAKDQNKLLRVELKKIKEELNQKVKNKELKRKDADVIYKEERKKFKEAMDLNIQNSLDLYFKKIKEAKIIVSNFSLLREGFDKPKLSFVIFGSPIVGKITIIQTLGRITRIAEDKPQPIALFPVTEVFESFSPRVKLIITNNVKSTYPEAKIIQR